jgi:signal recognition particle receptor subunit beta
MASLNPLTREVVFKIVFYGPGLGGKTTTLQHIHAASKPEHRGKMVSLATPMDRTLYFDFLPLRVPLVHGMHVRLQLFTVPGQVYFGATRKLVLTGADGIVFVADSQIGRQDANQEALEDLVMNLAENNLSLMELPHTFHWNKRDLPEIVSLAELDRTLNRQGAPSLGTVATQGDGVFAGLERITRLVFEAYEASLPKAEADVTPERGSSDRPAIEETTIADALRGLAEAPTRSRSTPTDALAAVKSGPTSSHGGPTSAVPVSSLESIPNPIPRRPTGSFDNVVNGAPASSSQLSSAGKGPPPLPARVPTARLTPPPSEALANPPILSPSPSPPRVVPSSVAPQPSTAPVSAPAPAVVSASGASPASVPSGPAVGAPASAATPALAGAQPVAPIREEPRARRDIPTSPPPPSRTSAGLQPFTFAPLWAEGDRDTVRQTETAIAGGDLAGAVLTCELLVTRMLASAAGLTGNADAPRDPGLVALLLGLDGLRYLAFRKAVRAARMHEPVSAVDALEAYAFALEVRRALAVMG